jgi:hypothetical protein
VFFAETVCFLLDCQRVEFLQGVLQNAVTYNKWPAQYVQKLGTQIIAIKIVTTSRFFSVAKHCICVAKHCICGRDSYRGHLQTITFVKTCANHNQKIIDDMMIHNLVKYLVEIQLRLWDI